MVVKILLYVLLLIPIFFLAYNLTLASSEFKRKRYINDFIGNLNDKYEERAKLREAKLLYEGVTEDKGFIDRIDNLIDKSSIRVIFPFVTSEVLIAVTILFASILAYLFNKYYPFWLFTITVFMGTIFLVGLLLSLMARHTYNKIDDQLLIYINTLINLCGANDDIVTIFDKAIPYVKEPLKQYTEQFVFECRRGIAAHKAFKNFEDKIESKRFKQLLKNLAICSRHEANYKEILSKSKVILKHYFAEKERRRRAIFNGRVAILSTVAIGLYLFKMVSSFNPTLGESLKYTAAGNVLMGYNLVVLLVAIYKFVTLDKFNY